ncbi:MAG: SDR family NAD(P)-dependent oxidoreductase [Chloroflexi bacterium]|nr:SDR family NAD(P)-dependent oxidoreductase [Chloroflexota bacterium]
MSSEATGRAVVTGASSGIGAATARRLSAMGFAVTLGARRLERLEALAKDLGSGAQALRLDVTDEASVTAFAAAVPSCEVLVCNAGGALGLEPVTEISEDYWRQMWEANVMGVVRCARAFLPQLIASGNGRIVVVTSVAGHQIYVNGGGYTAAKHAAAVVTDTLRLELLGKPVRVTEIAPGMVETEFSLVRFAGDEERATNTYKGMTPLTADNVAEAIVWAVTRPANVTIARIDLFSRAQGSARDVYREPSS